MVCVLLIVDGVCSHSGRDVIFNMEICTIEDWCTHFVYDQGSKGEF